MKLIIMKLKYQILYRKMKIIKILLTLYLKEMLVSTVVIQGIKRNHVHYQYVTKSMSFARSQYSKFYLVKLFIDLVEWVDTLISAKYHNHLLDTVSMNKRLSTYFYMKFTVDCQVVQIQRMLHCVNMKNKRITKSNNVSKPN